MKTIKDKNYIEVNHEGIYYPINEEQKSIVLNGTEYILQDDVWDFLLCLDSERDYFKDKFLELSGVKAANSINKHSAKPDPKQRAG